MTTQDIAIHKNKARSAETGLRKALLLWPQDINRALRRTAPVFSPLSFWNWNDEDGIFPALQRQTDKLFGNVFDKGWMHMPWWAGMTAPDVDIVENGQYFKIKADLPGLEADDIDLSVEEGCLTIAGEKQKEEQEEGENYLRQECLCGSFSRTIPLPAEADVDQATASFDQNVLTIDIPKKADASRNERKLKIGKARNKGKHSRETSHQRAA